MDNNYNSDNPQHIYKVILCGDTGVGKTHLMTRYQRGCPPRYDERTVGVEFANETVLIGDKQIKVQYWDTAGQEKFRGIAYSHFQQAEGAFIVYDVTNKESFENVVNWIKELRLKAEPEIVIMLVGNKLDLLEADEKARQVSLDVAEKIAIEYKTLFQELSALSRVQARKCFDLLLQGIVERRNKIIQVSQQ